MTRDMMALRRLLEKSSDTDLLREMIGFAADRTGRRDPYWCHSGEKSGEEPSPRLTRRNGYRDQAWETRAGAAASLVGSQVQTLINAMARCSSPVLGILNLLLMINSNFKTMIAASRQLRG